MIYKVGDKVAHPGHGGCIVRAICEREFGGGLRRYFVLIPETDPNTTILAPVDNTDKIGLREIISADQADRLLDYFSESHSDLEWVDDHAKRRQAYNEVLKEGDLTSIAKMIKELKTQEAEAKLNHSDKELLPKAQKRLFSEIALAKDIAFERVMLLAQAVV